MIVARVGGLSHPDADPANGNWGGREADGRGSTFSLLDEAEWEILPDAFRGRADRIFPGEELNGILARVRVAPRDADSFHALNVGQIEEHPLRIPGVIFAGELVREIRIAFPVCMRITVRQTRVTDGLSPIVAGDAAMGQRISVTVADHFCGI